MKKFLLVFVIAAACQLGYSQIEVKVNPIGLIFSNVDLGVEFGINEHFGIEPRLIVDFDSYDFEGEKWSSSRFGTIVEGKYYFNPSKGINKFYVDLYGKFITGKITASNEPDINSTRLAMGFGLGYKWVNRKNFVIELGFGVGRAFINEISSEDASVDLADFPILNIDLVGKFMIGYRF
ncbi:MAG: DUF3575 domain-containing protein [Saprospiraceae bacterium]|nr:DUF3575 domain-containing protein [Saprospiraceae bacterium]